MESNYTYDNDRKFIEELKSYAWDKVRSCDNYMLFDRAMRATIDFIRYVCLGTYEDLAVPNDISEKLNAILSGDLNQGEECE